jgi:triacylglycerol lipase
VEATTSWKALVDPGAADDFFQIEGLPAFDARAASAYSPGNALWLSESSRLVYREEEESRKRFFEERAGLVETGFFDPDAAQGALLRGRGFAILAFRGTLGADDWLSDLDCPPVPWEGEGEVHRGFKRQLDPVWPEVRAALDALDVPAFYTGHSLGAALATLAAARRLREGGAPPAALYTFGSPRVGTAELARVFPAAFLHCRVVNDRDVVATLPPRRLSAAVFGSAYRHVGVPFRIRRDGALERGAPDDDAAPALFDELKERWREELARIREAGVWNCVEPLIDHAPVNYTAGIEKAGRGFSQREGQR